MANISIGLKHNELEHKLQYYLDTHMQVVKHRVFKSKLNETCDTCKQQSKHGVLFIHCYWNNGGECVTHVICGESCLPDHYNPGVVEIKLEEKFK